ncbi:hypothetical protein RN001_016375 [Aquatica leii]|uniref:Metaxin glutathione S-transferase domain-containing protein n=1 Tax=Aquatica leii TaxID=1421715 RepID=A0AAN7S642_9COLE|nr:hypothetical protein RN001_016375 [Aquatica leii]
MFFQSYPVYPKTIVKIFKIRAVIKTAYFPFITGIPSIRENRFLTDDKTKLLKHVFKMCKEDLHFTVQQQLKLEAYKSYFMENFVEPFYFDCWIHETNYRHAIETWFTNVIPFPFSTFYLNKNRAHAQKAFSIYTPKWNYESYMCKKYEDAAICLGDFNYLLKDGRKFIYKNTPTSIDAIIYSYLMIAMHIPLHNPTLQTLIYRHGWLVNYVNRITEEYFPNTPSKYE